MIDNGSFHFRIVNYRGTELADVPLVAYSFYVNRVFEFISDGFLDSSSAVIR